MPKRTAEKQLTDRNVDEEDDASEPSVNGDFARASSDALSQRKIKGLPGRKASPFSALPSSQPIHRQKSADGPVISSSNGASPQSTARDDVQTLIRYRGLNVSALKAFADLTKRISTDAFVDLSAALEDLSARYKQARIPLRSTSDAASLPSAPAPTPATFAFALPTMPAAMPTTESEESATVSAPTPPTSFSFGGRVVDTSRPTAPTSTTPAAGGFTGFTPKPVSAAESGSNTSIFSFPTTTPSSQSTAASPVAAADTPKTTATASLTAQSAFNLSSAASATPRKPSPLRQAESLSSPASSSVAPPPPPITTTAPADPPAKLNPFAGFSFGKPAAATTSAPPVASTSAAAMPSAFASSPAATPVTPPKPLAFGSGKSNSPPAFGSAKFASGAASPFGGGSVNFSFGTMSDSSAPTANPFAAITAPRSAFSNLPTQPVTDANPVSSSASAGLGATAPAFSFSGPATTETPSPTPPPIEEGGDAGTEPTPPAADGEVGGIFAAGEGEENEETLCEVRGRIYNLARLEDGDTGHVVRLRVKKDKVTGVRRLLARAEGNGAVILNARLFKQFEVRILQPVSGDVRPGRTIVFSTLTEAKPVTWKLRVKNEEVAKGFIDTVHAQVAHLT